MSRARLAALLCLVLAAAIAYAATAGPRATEVTGPPLTEPPQLVSENGVLRATFTAERSRIVIGGREVRARTYDGTFVGPTLVVKPGNTIELTLVNRLPRETNIHFHGFHVSPSGNSDNVFLMIEPGTTQHYRVEIPSDMAPGEYWYHSHAHPYAEGQVFGGLSGVIIVDGLTDALPADLRTVTQRVLALKDFQVRKGVIPSQNIDSGAPTTRTVNGLVDPTIAIRPGETQLWRIANIGADIWYKLRLPGVTFHVIGEDANPVGEVWEADTLVMPPGKRYEVLVQGPAEGTHQLVTEYFDQGPDGDQYPRRRLATVVSSGASETPLVLPTTLVPFDDLRDARVDRRRTIVFSENPQTNQFYINGMQFHMGHVDEVARLGDVEQWTIRNTSRELHPFHIHVDDFQVISVNGKPYDARGHQDTVPLPIHGRVVIRLRFTDFTGRFVFHCHILAHEDNGMMATIRVVDSG